MYFVKFQFNNSKSLLNKSYSSHLTIGLCEMLCLLEPLNSLRLSGKCHHWAPVVWHVHMRSDLSKFRVMERGPSWEGRPASLSRALNCASMLS